MTDIRADERVIAELLGAQDILDVDHWTTGTIVISADRVVISGIGANLASAWLPWLPSGDANLWPGIMEKVYEDMDLLGRFGDCLSSLLVERRHRISCPYGPLAALKEGPESWTIALAHAIREMKEG